VSRLNGFAESHPDIPRDPFVGVLKTRRVVKIDDEPIAIAEPSRLAFFRLFGERGNFIGPPVRVVDPPKKHSNHGASLSPLEVSA
jgi:hypothetical protein